MHNYSSIVKVFVFKKQAWQIVLQVASRSSKTNTFGWVRAEVLGALINGVFLLALCFSIFIESITRLIEPQMIKQPTNVLIVGTIGLIINLIGMFMFHSKSFTTCIHHSIAQKLVQSKRDTVNYT